MAQLIIYDFFVKETDDSKWSVWLPGGEIWHLGQYWIWTLDLLRIFWLVATQVVVVGGNNQWHYSGTRRGQYDGQNIWPLIWPPKGHGMVICCTWTLVG